MREPEKREGQERQGKGPKNERETPEARKEEGDRNKRVERSEACDEEEVVPE